MVETLVVALWTSLERTKFALHTIYTWHRDHSILCSLQNVHNGNSTDGQIIPRLSLSLTGPLEMQIKEKHSFHKMFDFGASFSTPTPNVYLLKGIFTPSIPLSIIKSRISFLSCEKSAKPSAWCDLKPVFGISTTMMVKPKTWTQTFLVVSSITKLSVAVFVHSPAASCSVHQELNSHSDESLCLPQKMPHSQNQNHNNSYHFHNCWDCETQNSFYIWLSLRERVLVVSLVVVHQSCLQFRDRHTEKMMESSWYSAQNLSHLTVGDTLDQMGWSLKNPNRLNLPKIIKNWEESKASRCWKIFIEVQGNLDESHM